MSRLLRLLLASLALLAFAAVACGDDDDGGADPTEVADDGDQGDDDGNGAGNGGDGDSDDGDSDDGDSDDGDSGSSDGDGNGDGDSGSGDDGDSDSGDDDNGGSLADAFESLSEAAESASGGSFKVTYQITSDIPGEGSTSGTYTIASDPPNSSITISGDFAGQDGNVTLITTEDSVITCFEDAGVGECISFPADAPGGGFFEVPDFLATDETLDEFIDEPGVDVTSTGSRTIAGIEADCYHVESVDEGEADVCIGDNRILFMETSSDEGDFSFEALESGDPSPADFEPPYDVTELELP